LSKEKTVIQERISKTYTLLASIGGQNKPDQAKLLILSKIYDQISSELNRYLSSEKRYLLQSTENLWDKYSLSMNFLEESRNSSLLRLSDFLHNLGYTES